MELSSKTIDGDVLKVSLAGRLDIVGTDAIDVEFTSLTATRKDPVIVDLAEVTFLASIGVRTLLTSANALKVRGGLMVLTNAQPSVRQVLSTWESTRSSRPPTISTARSR